MTNFLNLPWYYLALYLVGEVFILWIFDKKRIIKSKQLRFLIVTFVYTLIFWVIYDLVLAPK